MYHFPPFKYQATTRYFCQSVSLIHPDMSHLIIMGIMMHITYIRESDGEHVQLLKLKDIDYDTKLSCSGFLSY